MGSQKSGPTSDFWLMFGIGLMVFLMCSGVGSCLMMSAIGSAQSDASRAQEVSNGH